MGKRHAGSRSSAYLAIGQRGHILQPDRRNVSGKSRNAKSQLARQKRMGVHRQL